MRDIRSGSLGTLVAVLLLFTIQSFADSHVRIVRLSDVEGSVQVDRNTGQGFEKALLNLPMTQGVKLRTNDDARAEVEFEDGTTLRLGSNTVVHFDELSLADSGVKNSVVTVAGGVVYVDYTGKSDNNFSLNFARQTTKLTERTHLRLEMDAKEAALAVFSGQVHIQSGANSNSAMLEDVFVHKNQTADFNLEKQGQYQLVKDIVPDVFDDWDQSQEKYHDRYAKAAYQNPLYSYGMSDLNYYGHYVNVPGYGLVWQPFLAGAGWDPYMNGAWAWYPGIGYMWVSAYPWGWMPFYYGSWNYLDSFGWFWNPSGTGQSWNPAPVIATGPPTFSLPRPPARPPVVRGGRSLFVVNRVPLPVMRSPNRIVLRNDSAGLGIPRGSIHNWNKVNTQVQREGFVTTRVHSTPMPVMMPPMNAGQPSFRPATGQPSFRPPSNGSSISTFHGTAGEHSFPSSAPARSSPMGGGSSSGAPMHSSMSGGSFGGGSNAGSSHSSPAPSGGSTRSK